MKENQQLQRDIIKRVESGEYRDYYLVYNRKSTDEPENQKNSIKYQKSENTRFAYREHLSIANISIERFCSDGIISEKHSAFKEDSELILGDNGLVQYRIDRPKFATLVQLLNKRYFKGVIVLCWDRISRNKGDESIIRKLIKAGIDFRFTLATYDKSSSGALHMDIDGMFAEHHSRVTSEKVLLNIRNQREKGKCTFKAPVGYLNIGTMDDKPFDPERASIVKQMFELYAKGNWSLTDLKIWAISQGFTMTPARKRRNQQEKMQEEDDDHVALPKVSRLPNNSAIHRILTNPFYTGRIKGNNEQYIKSTSHKALISETLFNDVQKRLKSKSVSIHYVNKIKYPLRGCIRCNDCKRIYTPYLKKGIVYYSSHCKQECANQNKNFNVSQLVGFIGDMMLKLCFTQSELDEINNTASSSEIKILEEKRHNLIDINERKRKKIKEDLEYLQLNKLNLLKTGVYTPEGIVEEENNLKNEITKLQSDEIVPNASINETIRNTIKLSELLKTLHLYYENANHEEKDAIIRFIFSELNLYQKTLIYKCENGFKALKNRFVAPGFPDTWLSELPYYSNSIKQSITEVETYLSTHSSQDVPI